MDLAWINGHPQFLVDDLAFSVPLDGRTVTAVRIVPTDGAPWAVSEVLLHGVADGGAAWPDEGAGPADAGWLYRSLLARRHP